MKRQWDKTEEYGQLGIIESVSLRNFMCHDNLTFDFDPHMNFIIGQNGSGKSAVLTGVILALGGKSGSTGRHTNIKGFIKTGKNSATVSVTLKNCGPEAYKTSEYGSKITVERHFNSDGVSQYKLKSQRGQIISTSKEELKSILTIMDIQIENPITVLTQEISRNFLVSKNSKGHKLFQLFYSGTGLARVEEDYHRAMSQKEEAENEVKLKKSALPEMKKEIKNIQTVLHRDIKVKELKAELMWANVINLEKDRDELQERMLKVEGDINKLQKNLDMYKTKDTKVDQSLSQAKDSKKESMVKINALRTTLQDLTSKRNDIKTEIREMKGTYSRYEREVNKLSGQSNNLENMINDIKLKDQSDVHNNKLIKEAKVKSLKQEVSQVRENLDSLDAQKDKTFEGIANMNRKMENLQAEIQELKSTLTDIEREKKNLTAGMKDRKDVFGPELKPLLQEIQRATKNGVFKLQPKGPIGLDLSVKDADWNFAVQVCLGAQFLKTFCCDNHADAEQLTKIINKYYANSRSKPSIITTKYVSKVFDVSRYKTNAGHPTVLDMLDMKDPVIANCLIDQKQIENILLIADQKAAIDLMMDNPPKNCNSAYTLSGDQICHTPYRYYSCRNTNQICMLKTVNLEDISKKDREIDLINGELSAKMNSKRALQGDIDKEESERKKIDSQFTSLRVKLKHLQMKIKEEETAFEEPKDINCLQTELEKLLEEKQQNEEKLAEIKADVSLKEGELASYEEKIEESKEELQLETENYTQLTAQIDELENKKESIDVALKKIEMQLRTLMPSKDEYEFKLKDNEATIEVMRVSAERSGPRIDTQRSADTIRRLLKETQKTVEQQGNFDPEALSAEYKEKERRYKEAEAELEKQECVNKQIGRMMDKRFEEFRKICKNNIVSLTCSFTSLLKENHFTGYPDVNLDAQTLEIIARPDKIKSKIGQGKKNQNLAQLSGGERSYVTIAFLLALWDRIHMPFRILDEYDVFMDPNNRHRSIHLLVNAARANRSIQYIFLSPLELPEIADSSHVKVHKMAAPKR